MRLAVETRRRAIPDRTAGAARMPADLRKLVRTLRSKHAGYRPLIFSEYADRKTLRFRKHRMARGRLRDTDQDQRRIKRHGRKRIRSKTTRRTIGLNGRHHSHARHECAQCTAKLASIEGRLVHAFAP